MLPTCSSEYVNSLPGMVWFPASSVTTLLRNIFYLSQHPLWALDTSSSFQLKSPVHIIILIIFYFMRIGISCMYVCASCACSALRGQKRARQDNYLFIWPGPGLKNYWFYPLLAHSLLQWFQDLLPIHHSFRTTQDPKAGSKLEGATLSVLSPSFCFGTSS